VALGKLQFEANFVIFRVQQFLVVRQLVTLNRLARKWYHFRWPILWV